MRSRSGAARRRPLDTDREAVIPEAPRQTPHPGRHRALLERYGFGLFPLPAYRAATVGDWRVVRYGPGPVEGYLPGLVMEPGRHVLHHGRTPWMSTSLMEQESHAFHIGQARGVVVVAGLGLAMYPYAAALKPEVEQVVVVERSPEVIAVVREAAGLGSGPLRDKLSVVEADALDSGLAARVEAETGGRAPDYLYADIWEDCGAPEAPLEAARMVEALRPEAAGWWGQELSFGAWCREAEREPDAAALEAYAGRVGAPLPAPEGYPAFCRDVIAARVPRRRRPRWSRLRWPRLRRRAGRRSPR